jgi:GH15 family glucan-1,4-alpha-glucosidase
VGTVRAIERELLQDALVLRFKPEAEVDGLSGDEGVFVACSFWLARVYHMMGREEDACRLFDRAASTCNDLGLLAEEYDPREKRQLGNFPQAFSHFALVNAAFTLAQESPRYLVPQAASDSQNAERPQTKPMTAVEDIFQ